MNRLIAFMTVLIAAIAWPAWQNRGPEYEIDTRTYLGKGIAGIRDVDVDADGNIYATGGATASPDLPNSLQPDFGGRQDVIVLKISRDGKLLWWRLIGGPNHDRAYAIEVGSDGGIYLAGRAGEGFPTTRGVVQPDFGGDVESRPDSLYGKQDGFLARLDRDGKLIWSSYFGGKGDDFIRDIDVDAGGAIHVASTSVSFPFPHVTTGEPHAGRHDGVVARVSTDGKKVLWATHIGGSGNDFEGPSIRVDRDGNTYAVGSTNSTDLKTRGAIQEKAGGGQDLHLVKYGRTGELLWHTYIGGPMDEGTETHQLAVDGKGSAVIGVTTFSDTGLALGEKSWDKTYNGTGGDGTGNYTNYPGDVFLVKFSTDGKAVLGSTYFGGRFGEGIEGIDVDAEGNIHITGGTFSPDLPMVNAVQARSGTFPDYFAAVFSPDLDRLLFSTFIGGNGWDVARACVVGTDGRFVFSGEARSTNIEVSGRRIAPPADGEKENALLVVLGRKK